MGLRPVPAVLRGISSAVHDGEEDVLRRLTHGLDQCGEIPVGQLIGLVLQEAQHQIAAVAHHIVGEHHALTPPLAPQHIIEQIGIGAAVNIADEVEGGHHRHGISGSSAAHVPVCLHADLKGLHADLSDGLLVGTGQQDGAAVGLLIVENKVLDIGIDSIAGTAVHHGGRHGAAQHAILGIILKITAAEGVAAGVRARAVPASDLAIGKLRTQRLAGAVGKLGVPGLADQHSVRNEVP